MAYGIEWRRNLVEFRYSGNVTPAEILASNQRVYGDDRFDELRRELVIFEPNCEVEFDPKVLQKLAYLDRAAFLSNPRIQVVLVGSRKIQETVYRSYAEHADPHGWEVIAFATEAEARAFLGLDSPTSGD